LDFVAIFIPIYPQKIEVTAPVTNAIVVNPVPGTGSAYKNTIVPNNTIKAER
jgi:hypothetical protein